jgi:hypothetical protein
MSPRIVNLGIRGELSVHALSALPGNKRLLVIIHSVAIVNCNITGTVQGCI